MPKRILLTAALGAAVALATYGVAMATHGVLVGPMDGAQVVNVSTGQPNAGDPDGTGGVKIRLLPDQDKLCYKTSWVNVNGPTQANVFKGARGANGSLTLTLFSINSPLPSTVSYVGGCVNVDDAVSADIRAHPDQYYVTVNTDEFRQGALRAQLKDAPRKRR